MANAANEKPSAGGAHDLQPLPLDLESPQFTLRAVLTGMLLAGLLSACNIYTGLKIGWGLPMAITAALVAYAGWIVPHAIFGVRKFGILENNINQTAASAGASVSSAGLVAPIPALAMLTGQTLDWHWLALWVFSVCLVGIVAAIGLRRQMLVVDKLPFAGGIAAAETLRELYAKGSEALKRVGALVSAALVAAPLQWLSQFPAPVFHFKLPPFVPLWFSVKGFTAKSLTFGINSTLLMYGLGGLIGFRACASMVVGAVLAWGILAPRLIQSENLRLELSEPLSALPTGVDLRPDNEGFPKFDETKNLLLWKGVMSTRDRAALLGQTSTPLFCEAVEKLYVRSQLELAEPLAALPSMVALPPNSPVAYDARRHLLIAKAGFDRQTYGTWRELSPDGAYRAALDALFSRFCYATTRRVQISEPLKQYPARFPIPRECGATLMYNRERHAVVARDAVTPPILERVTQAAREHARRQPEQRAACDELVAAVTRLHERAAQPPLPADFAVPAPLSGVVRYDAAGGTLRATGILTRADKETLLAALPADSPALADYKASIAALVAGTGFVRAAPDYQSAVKWLLWPGVTLMVVASLVSFGFSWRSILGTFTGHRRSAAAAAPPDTGEVTRRWFIALLVVALLTSTVLQVSFFKIVWWAAVVGVLISFVLAIVAARVSGETNITPVGAMGKVTQLLFGVLTPGHVEPNLMAANVTGGAASQCADLLHDLKCGYLIGALPRLQVWAQLFGALAGSLAGSAIYLILIPNPQEQLITDQWAAPAVATWKAVAELFKVGFKAIPAGTPVAMLIAAVAAVGLAVLEKVVPKKARAWVPSPASLGLAFVIQAYTCMTMFTGAVVALLLSKFFKDWSSRYLIAICAGIVAGESLMGVGIALWNVLAG